MTGRLTIVFLLFCLFPFSLKAQINPVPDPLPNAQADAKALRERVKAMNVKAVKLILKAKLFREKRKVFNRDNELIAKLEAVIEFDDLIEALVDKKTDEFMAQANVGWS